MHRDVDGQMGIYKLDPRNGRYTPLIVNDVVEPNNSITEIGRSNTLIGAVFESGKPELRFLDEDNATAKIYRMLESAFPGMSVRITSSTLDGKKAIVRVESDRNPADFYLFDVEKAQVAFLVASREWISADKMGERRPVSYTASDGMTIHGYLTLPPGKEARNLPLVMIVHGGPHGPRDYWSFDLEAQLLATRGYAVFQPNYRGSGGFGDGFETSGYHKWGTRMQDDMTDGVKWLVAEGIANPERLCVYGGSYGGYSALQQLVRYPEFWKCGFGFVGVYDLDLMFEEGDIPESDSGINFLNKVLGEDLEVRAAQSPARHVEDIKAALYIAHGKEDVRAHVDHYYLLKEELDKHNIPHEELLVENEGHGFYDLDNRELLYTELIDFIDEHIGD